MACVSNIRVPLIIGRNGGGVPSDAGVETIRHHVITMFGCLSNGIHEGGVRRW